MAELSDPRPKCLKNNSLRTEIWVEVQEVETFWRTPRNTVREILLQLTPIVVTVSRTSYTSQIFVSVFPMIQPSSSVSIVSDYGLDGRGSTESGFFL
jgi:hypothetical protein